MGNASSSRILKLDSKVELGKFPDPQGGRQTEIRHTGALGENGYPVLRPASLIGHHTFRMVVLAVAYRGEWTLLLSFSKHSFDFAHVSVLFRSSLDTVPTIPGGSEVPSPS